MFTQLTILTLFMLTLGDLDDQMNELGNDYTYSWNLKKLVARKVLVSNKYFGHVSDIRRVREIQGPNKGSVTIYIEEKTGWLKTEQVSFEVTQEQYNRILNETFPLKDADLYHFKKIQNMYKKLRW